MVLFWKLTHFAGNILQGTFCRKHFAEQSVSARDEKPREIYKLWQWEIASGITKRKILECSHIFLEPARHLSFSLPLLSRYEIEKRDGGRKLYIGCTMQESRYRSHCPSLTVEKSTCTAYLSRWYPENKFEFDGDSIFVWNIERF